MKKQLPTDAISSELAQSSVFFQKPIAQDKPTKPHLSQPEQSHSPAAPAQEKKTETSKQAVNEESKEDGMTAGNTDVNHDVMTSLSQDMNLRKWQEVIENTETQNSALRLTSEERYAIEDVVNELRRKYGIKTSMNEVARLGLLFLIHDFKKNKKESMIHKVKKA
jgi:hypothetical protein